MKAMPFTILLLFIVQLAHGQQKIIKNDLVTYPDGALIKWHSYHLKLPQGFNGYVTFGRKPVHTDSRNHYSLIGYKNDTLRVYQVKKGISNDTELVQTTSLRFEEPHYTVFFIGQHTGSTIDIDKLPEYSSIYVTILNIDFDLRIPTKKIKVKYLKNGSLIERSFSGIMLPHDIAIDIVLSKTPLLIFDIQIIPNNHIQNLAPVVYYTKYAKQ